MSRWGRFGIGVVVVAACIVIGGWFDTTVLRAAKQEQARTFDIGPLLPVMAIGYLIVAGGSLAIGVAGWRLRSLGLALAYIAIGAFFTFIDTITWELAAKINGAPQCSPSQSHWQSGTSTHGRAGR